MKSNNKTKGKKEESAQINSESDLNNIKSKYIIQKILDNIKKNNSFKLIKYNKKIQNKLDLSIDDYKAYSECFTTIEIEVTPCKNGYGRFINIINKEEEPYYHIYFNESKEEIKRNVLTEDDKVTKIKIMIDYPVKSLKNYSSNVDVLNQ